MCSVFDSRRGYHFSKYKRPEIFGALFIARYPIDGTTVRVRLVRSYVLCQSVRVDTDVIDK